MPATPALWGGFNKRPGLKFGFSFREARDQAASSMEEIRRGSADLPGSRSAVS